MKFRFHGKTYKCSEKEQFEIFKLLKEQRDWITLSNRIINQLKWGSLLNYIPELTLIK